MAEFRVGDKVRVEMPQGYSKRGVLGISVLYTTSPEGRFDGATGVVTEINPVGPVSKAQYLVDFRPFDNSKLGIPWQAQWFREEWLDLLERDHMRVAHQPQMAHVSAEGSAPPAKEQSPNPEANKLLHADVVDLEALAAIEEAQGKTKSS